MTTTAEQTMTTTCHLTDYTIGQVTGNRQTHTDTDRHEGS